MGFIGSINITIQKRAKLQVPFDQFLLALLFCDPLGVIFLYWLAFSFTELK